MNKDELLKSYRLTIESNTRENDRLQDENSALAAHLGAMREALKNSALGWENIVELKLIPERYFYSAQALQEQARTALATDPPFVLKALETRVWNEAVEAIAEVAKAHKGAAAKKRHSRGQRLSQFNEFEQAEITAEERGEDIAAEIIEREIRSLKRSQEDG